MTVPASTGEPATYMTDPASTGEPSTYMTDPASTGEPATYMKDPASTSRLRRRVGYVLSYDSSCTQCTAVFRVVSSSTTVWSFGRPVGSEKCTGAVDDGSLSKRTFCADNSWRSANSKSLLNVGLATASNVRWSVSSRTPQTRRSMMSSFAESPYSQ